jgi:hypothetical protein
MTASSSQISRIRNRVQRPSYDLVMVVDRVGTALISPKCPKIYDMPFIPEDTIGLRVPCQRIDQAILRNSDDQPAIVNPICPAARIARQGAEIARDTVLPGERVIDKQSKKQFGS